MLETPVGKVFFCCIVVILKIMYFLLIGLHHSIIVRNSSFLTSSVRSHKDMNSYLFLYTDL